MHNFNFVVEDYIYCMEDLAQSHSDHYTEI